MVTVPSPSLTELCNSACLCRSEFSVRGGIQALMGVLQRGVEHKEECCPEDLEVPSFCNLSHIVRHHWAEPSYTQSPSLAPVPALPVVTVTPGQRLQPATGSSPFTLEPLLNSVCY